MTGRIQVDAARLAQLLERIAQFDAHLDESLREVDRRIQELHLTWTGSAADTHQAAHAEWTRGAEEMRAGLLAMRRIAATAHANYTGAVAANVGMWQQAGG